MCACTVYEFILQHEFQKQEVLTGQLFVSMNVLLFLSFISNSEPFTCFVKFW